MIYYLNVYVFINQLKALVPFKSEEVVCANILSCLYEGVVCWYIIELSDEECWDLGVHLLNLGWFVDLEKRFKSCITKVLSKVILLSSIYSWQDIRVSCSVTKWVQNILCDIQATELLGITVLLWLVWTCIELTFQHDVRELTLATTTSQFIAELD